MKQNLLFVGVLFSTLVLNAQESQDSTKVEALDEVVLSDSRFQLKRENSGKTVIKINASEIAKQQGRSVAELINAKSGIEINGSRSNGGQNLGYFVRGGNNRQVLVLIDGIQVSDPSQLANDYDLRLLDLNQIESIEIIKGAASTLYGNAAATAVINITTKKASNRPISAVFSSSIGTNSNANNSNTNIADFNNSIYLSGTSKKFRYNTSFSHQYLDGLSAVTTGTERDAFSRTSVGVKLGYNASTNFSIDAYANRNRYSAEYDNSFPIEDANFSTNSEQYRIGISPKFVYGDGSFTVNAAYNAIDREFFSNFPGTFSGKSIIIDAFNKYNFNDEFYTIVGLNYIENKTTFITNEKTTTIDPYANVVWTSKFGLNINVGARLNNHSEYGSNGTYNLNPSYVFKFKEDYLKLLSSFSTSFIAPSLPQLFGAFGPNPDLEPEVNTTFEAGAEFKLADKLRLSTIYFNRKEENFIDYVIIDFDTFEGQYQNTIADRKVHGVEVELSSKVTEQLLLSANYTFTERKELIALRIPKHKVNTALNYTINDKASIGLNYQYVGERTDTNFSSFENETLTSFSLVDLLFNKELIKNRLHFSTSIQNLLNEDYTEVIGFSTRGRNYRIGMRLNF